MIDPTIARLLDGTRPFYEWKALEQAPAMIDGGGADSGGPNRLPHGRAIWTPGQPATAASPATPALLVFDPVRRLPGQPWDNAYMYSTISRLPVTARYFCWELGFTLSTFDLKGNAREFEIELCEAGWTYNMAWQYKWSHVDGPPAWRVFDQVAKLWKSVPGLPAPLPRPGVYVNAAAFFLIDRVAGTTLHDSIAIDDLVYPVGMAHKKLQKWSAQTNYLHNAVQIDSMGDGAPGSIEIRDWNVRAV